MVKITFSGTGNECRFEVFLNVLFIKQADLKLGYGWAWAGQTTATEDPEVVWIVCILDCVGNFGAELPSGSVIVIGNHRLYIMNLTMVNSVDFLFYVC